MAGVTRRFLCWRAAEQMPKLYGADAAIHAAMRTDKLMDQGDTEGFGVWKRVATVSNEIRTPETERR